MKISNATRKKLLKRLIEKVNNSYEYLYGHVQLNAELHPTHHIVSIPCTNPDKSPVVTCHACCMRQSLFALYDLDNGYSAKKSSLPFLREVLVGEEYNALKKCFKGKFGG